MNWFISIGLLLISFGTQNPNWAIAAGLFVLAYEIETGMKKRLEQKVNEFKYHKIHRW